MSVRCPHCNNKLLQRSEGGTTRIRIEGPIEFDASGKAHGKCYWCKTAAVELPIVLKESGKERFVVKTPA